MDIYDEAMSDEKQTAHRKVLRLVTRKQDRTAMPYPVGNCDSCKYLILLASPTGFEPVLPP
jgi:hypothetical protein